VRQLPRARGGEEVRVEDEEGDDLSGRRRGPQWRMIGDAKVLAPEPDEGPHLALIILFRIYSTSITYNRAALVLLGPWLAAAPGFAADPAEVRES
jgi:hypothetical protein